MLQVYKTLQPSHNKVFIIIWRINKYIELARLTNVWIQIVQ